MQIVVIVVVLVVVVGACNEPKVKFNSLIMGQHMGQAVRGRGEAPVGVDFAVFCCAPSRPRKYAMQLMCSAVCPGCPLSSAALLPAQTMASSRFLPISSSLPSLPPLPFASLLTLETTCTMHTSQYPSARLAHTPHATQLPQLPHATAQSKPRRILGKPQLLRAHDFPFSSSSTSSSSRSVV